MEREEYEFDGNRPDGEDVARHHQSGRNMSSTATTARQELVMHDITAWNDGDVDVIDDIYADGAAYTDPMGAVHDRESLTEYIGMIRTAFPDFTVDVHQLLREGDTVACRYTFSGTMEDPYRGFEPTGESFELHGITWYHIQDEQVPTAWNATNSMAVAQQLGLLT